jgi:hypothetical protein
VSWKQCIWRVVGGTVSSDVHVVLGVCKFELLILFLVSVLYDVSCVPVFQD